MSQIQYFCDFIFKDDLPMKFRRYHAYLIYHVAEASKDLAKDITYYFKRCLKFNVLKLSPDISESTIVAMENEVKAMIYSYEVSTTSETTPDRV